MAICTGEDAAQAVAALDFAEAVYRFREEDNTVLYTPWRTETSPVVWVCGNFPDCDGTLLCGRWPQDGETNAVLLSDSQAAALFGTTACLERTLSVGTLSGTVVGVYRPRQSLPMMLSRPMGAPAYFMTEREPDGLLAVELKAGYDASLALSEIRQHLMSNGINNIQVENMVLTAAQTAYCVRIMLTAVIALYLLLILHGLKPVRRKSMARARQALGKDYLPAALLHCAAPLSCWLAAWLLPTAGLCACVWFVLDGVMPDPQLLPRVITGNAVAEAIKNTLESLNGHRLPAVVCCNVLLWTKRLAWLCFDALMLLYLPWRGEEKPHAK